MPNNPVVTADDRLKQQRPISLAGIKESCIYVLQQFIDSRAQIDSMGHVNIFPMTLFEQNKAVTVKQIEVARDLINQIRPIESSAMLYDLFKNNALPNAMLELESTVARCVLFTNILIEHERPIHASRSLK